MKANQEAAVTRLKALYGKQAEDQVSAHVLVPLPAELSARLDEQASRIPPDALPPVEQVFPLWEQLLSFYDKLEDDWVPAIYPRQYDQGIYGTLFGAEMEFNAAGTPGWASSNTRPLDGKNYDELLRLAAAPDDTWLRRMESDLRYLAAESGGRWGIGVAITIDALNLAQQIRGNACLLDHYDCPEDLKRFLDAGVDLNIQVVERQRAAIDMTFRGGVYDFFNGGWMPGQSIPMSVDCYNMCHPSVYAEFGRPYQQRLIDHFGGGNFHIHGNGRHLLPEMAKLKGCVVALLSDDGSDVTAMEDLANIKQQAGPITPVVACLTDTFVRRLREGSLPGGVHYRVGPCDTIDDANRLMESVRRYRA